MGRKAFILGVNTLGLRYSENDALLLKDCLEKHGYEIVFPDEISKYKIEEKFDNFIDNAYSEDTLIFFFSGHGYSPKGLLFLVIGEDVARRKNLISFQEIIYAFEDCEATKKLIILDCCNAGNFDWKWNPDNDAKYRILTASDFTKRSKELSSLEAGFLSSHISKALDKESENIREIVDKKGKISINELTDWLKTKVLEHNSEEDAINISNPRLVGEYNNFVIADLGPYWEQLTDLEVVEYELNEFPLIIQHEEPRRKLQSIIHTEREILDPDTVEEILEILREIDQTFHILFKKPAIIDKVLAEEPTIWLDDDQLSELLLQFLHELSEGLHNWSERGRDDLIIEIANFDNLIKSLYNQAKNKYANRQEFRKNSQNIRMVSRFLNNLVDKLTTQP